MSDRIKTPPSPPPVTRIARRTPTPGREQEYEELIRSMFAKMHQFPGFLGAELIPPESNGGDYQVIVHFASEADLSRWDTSTERFKLQRKISLIAKAEPQYRRLVGLEAWFATAVVPASMHPPRIRMAFVTWLGIFPTVSIFLYALGPLLQDLPFLARTAVLTILIVISMTWVIMPRLTKWMRPWLSRPST